MSEPKLSPTVRHKLTKWRERLRSKKGNVENETIRTATDVHIRLTKYPEVALTLHFLCYEYRKDWKRYQHIFVGKALAEYFAKYLGLSVEEFEKLMKPTLTLKDLKSKVKEYCDVVISPKTISKVIYYDWEQEKTDIHEVKVFVEKTLEVGFTDLTKWQLEEIKKLQARKHYGLFGQILDFYDSIGIEFFNKVYHEEKTRRKFSKLIKILSKAERTVKEIQLSVESYLKSGKT